MTEIEIDYVFIGSCTNGRIEDLRAAAEIARGYKVSDRVTAIVVPGSGRVKFKLRKKAWTKSSQKLDLNGVMQAADVSGDEPGRIEAGRTLCIDIQP